ncbi:MAG: hypothetical protein ACKPKO_57295, partial [Candidatus Fonsibacter sp.]
RLYDGDCSKIPTRLALGSDYLKSAFDIYKDCDGAKFDNYEHLGSVRPPTLARGDQPHSHQEMYSYLDQPLEDLPAADVLRHFGMDFNDVLDLSEDNQRASPVRPKKRDRSFTECIDVREWLIDTGCGHALLSKHEVSPYKEFVQKG